MVTGKTKAAIVEFAFCGSKYRDELRTLYCKIGQPQAVVTAHLDKLSNYPPVKKHNGDSLINFATIISSLVGVFRSLSHETDLHNSSLLSQDFNDWLKEKAEAHERLKTIFLISKTEDKGGISATKTIVSSKVSAAKAIAKQNISSKTSQSAKNDQLSSVLSKSQYPI